MATKNNTLKQCIGQQWNARRGVTLMMVMLLVVLFLSLGAYWLNVAYMELTRTQLQIATDAATRAGGEALSRLQDEAGARAAAKDLAARNLVAGSPLLLSDSDVVFGKSTANNTGTWSFTANATPTNAVQVTGRRTRFSAGGSAPLLIGKVLGVSQYETSLSSIAVQLDRDICLVLDRSGSMATRDAGGGVSRWEALKQAEAEFRRGIDSTRQTELAGLVSFSTSSAIDVRLTSTYTQIDSALNRMGPNGWTAISLGIDNGITVLTDTSRHRPFAYKTMVVMTDGIWNRGRTPVLAAKDAAAKGITIHTITFSSEANQADMIAVAAATGGKHYHAPDGAALKAAFKDIALTLPVVLTK